MKNKWLSILGLGVVFIVFFFFQFKALRNHSQSFYFQDETEHVTLGWMLQRFDKDLYIDISSNHQPLPILVGAAFSKVIKFNSLFQLIERTRLLMFAFGMLGSLFLSIRFKWSGLLSSILLQSVIYYYFGWHVLAESLVVPMIQFMMLSLWSLYHTKKVTKWIFIFDAVVMGLSSWWIIFSLLALWPFVLVVNLIYALLLFKKHQLKLFTISSSMVLLLTGIMFYFISPIAWWGETIFNPVKYFIPYLPYLDLVKRLEILFYPLLNAIKFTHFVGRWFLVLSLALSIHVAFKRKILLPLVAWCLLVLLNLRVYIPTQLFFTGFHLLPLMAGSATVTSIFLLKLIKIKSISKLGIGIVFLLLLINNNGWWAEVKDKQNESDIQYGTFQSLAHAINSIKENDDQLFSAPNGHGYLNMMTDLSIAGRQLFHLPWAYRSPKLRAEFEELMKNNPPTFIYFHADKDGYSHQLSAIVKKDYSEIKRTNGDHTNLFIRKDRIFLISKLQLNQLEHYQYQLISN